MNDEWMSVAFPAVPGALAYHVHVNGAPDAQVTIEPLGEDVTIAAYSDGTWIVNGQEWTDDPCGCGDDDPAGCMFANADYPWCRVCSDHHREPECTVDSEGRALWPDGTRQVEP